MDILLQSLVCLTKLDKRAAESILPFFKQYTVPTRTQLLTVDNYCKTIWFIGTGILRAYYHTEERKRKNYTEDINTREITSWIVPSGGFLTDISSFLHQKPASYNIETLCRSYLYTLSYDDYQTIQKMYSEIAQAVFEHTLLMNDQRVRMMSLRSPSERLGRFEKIYPTLKGQLSVNIQASYLNIDPATLSRLRAK